MQQGNSYVEVRPVREANALQKLCGSLCCSLAGLAVYLASLVLLARNEHGAVCSARGLQLLDAAHEEVGCEGGNGKAVFFSCPFAEESLPTWRAEDLGDEGTFEVKAVKLRRAVEMLQCVETRKTEQRKSGDQKVQVDRFSYHLEWRDRPVASQHFRGLQDPGAKGALATGCGAGFRGNPTFAVASRQVAAQRLSAGGHDLTRFLDRIVASEPVLLERRRAKDGRAYAWRDFVEYYQGSAAVHWREATPAAPSDVLQSCEEEVLGCLRIRYFKSSANHGSYMGALSQGKAKAYRAPAGYLCPALRVEHFSPASLTAEELLEEAEAKNSRETWLWRLAGVCASVLGVFMFLSPVQTLAELIDSLVRWLPLLGPVLGFLSGLLSDAVCCSLLALSCLVGLSSSGVVLSASWCFMRPLPSLCLALASLAALRLTPKRKTA